MSFIFYCRDISSTVMPDFNAQRRKSKPLEPVLSDAKASSEFVEIAQVFGIRFFLGYDCLLFEDFL